MTPRGGGVLVLAQNASLKARRAVCEEHTHIHTLKLLVVKFG